MAPIAQIRSANATLIKSQPLVAVVVGGTSGIGKRTVLALATTHASQGKGLRVYIVGRNTTAAEEIISDCLRDCPIGEFHFVHVQDVSLLRNVDGVCAEIQKLEEQRNDSLGPARVDFLLMSQGQLSFVGRRDTIEGLDKDMSLLYYSRMRFVVKLMPLLLASPLPARVVSVYAAGKEGKLFPNDLSLRSPEHYTFMHCQSHVLYMKTLFMERLANTHRGKLSLIHIFPGLVFTEGFDNPDLPWWLRWSYWLFAPLVRPFTVPPNESGERMLSLATPRYPANLEKDGETAVAAINVNVVKGSDGVVGSGAYALHWDGEPIPVESKYAKLDKEELSDKVWEHTMEAFSEIESKGAFTG